MIFYKFSVIQSEASLTNSRILRLFNCKLAIAAKARKDSFISLTKVLVVQCVSVDCTVQRLQNNELDKRVEG
jgi:RNA processing factor Prp31